MTEEIVFVAWKWHSPNGARHYIAEHINVHYAMVERYAPFPHRYVCITDDATGLNKKIEAVPMPRTGLEHVRPPTRYQHRTDWPFCYRRLWLFSEKAKKLGNRLFSLDVDCVITGDLTPLVEKQGNFVGWSDPVRFQPGKIAGGAYMLRAGTHLEVWEDFDPETSPQIAADAGHQGSDQAWMSYKLFPPEDRWTEKDGVKKIGWTGNPAMGPGKGTRIALTSGTAAPWHDETQRRYPWVREYWRL